MGDDTCSIPLSQLTVSAVRFNFRSQAALHFMQKLRSIHLYLGCAFAPMLLFFAVSGIWQTLGLHWHSGVLAWLSTLHTQGRLKTGSGLGSPALRVFVVIMALSFVVTTFLGVVMAITHGRNQRTAYYCLAFGVLFPLMIIIISHVSRANAVRRVQPTNPSIAGLALAAGNGDSNAIAEMNVLCRAATDRPVTSDDRGDKFRDFRQAFDSLGFRAGQGNDTAVEALLQAMHLDYLQGFAVDGLGKAAGMGNEAALEPLLHPLEYHLLPSGTVPALQTAADNGNQQAIDALAAVAADVDSAALWYMTAVGLQKATTVAGNVTAIEAMGLLAKAQNKYVSNLAIETLRTASSNHIARATEILRKLTSQ